MFFFLSPGLLFCFLRQQGEEATQTYEMEWVGDPPLSERRPPWQLLRHSNSATVTVLLADGMVRPSRASKHINALWVKRSVKTIIHVTLRHTRQEGDSTL